MSEDTESLARKKKVDWLKESIMNFSEEFDLDLDPSAIYNPEVIVDAMQEVQTTNPDLYYRMHTRLIELMAEEELVIAECEQIAKGSN